MNTRISQFRRIGAELRTPEPHQPIPSSFQYEGPKTTSRSLTDNHTSFNIPNKEEIPMTMQERFNAVRHDAAQVTRRISLLSDALAVLRLRVKRHRSS